MVDIYFQSCTRRHYVTSLAYCLPKLNFHPYLQYVEYLKKLPLSTSPRKKLLYKKIAKTYPKFLNPRQKLLPTD